MKSGADGGELHSLKARISVCAGHRGSLGYEEEECAICAAGTGLSSTTAQLS